VKLVRNDPNPGLMVSLRFCGYSNYSAVMDIADNSLDAQARNIWVNCVTVKGERIVQIIDDGRGMTASQLDEALKLASRRESRGDEDLGKFGMGLVTAGHSIGRRIEVITRPVDSPAVMRSASDLDLMAEHDDFVKEAIIYDNAEDRALLDQYVGPGHSGTIVTILKCDNLGHNTTEVSEVLAKRMAQTFRFFIGQGVNIHINKNRLTAIDPLMRNDPATTFHTRMRYPVTYTTRSGEKRRSQIYLTMVTLSDSVEMAGTTDNAGFYVLRNGREIHGKSMLGLRGKHPDFRRFRGELSFSSELDEVMGVNFEKQRCELNGELLEELRKLTDPIFRRISAKERERKIIKNSTLRHDAANKRFRDRSRHLQLPQIQVEERNTKTCQKDKKAEKKEPKAKQQTRTPRRIRLKNGEMEGMIQHVRLGVKGPVYEPLLEGRCLTVRLNVDHEFYVNCYHEAPERIISAIDLFLYSWSTSELRARTDENSAMLEEMRGVMSDNLRLLLTADDLLEVAA
jgi:hypothetical protein